MAANLGKDSGLSAAERKTFRILSGGNGYFAKGDSCYIMPLSVLLAKATLEPGPVGSRRRTTEAEGAPVRLPAV